MVSRCGMNPAWRRQPSYKPKHSDTQASQLQHPGNQRPNRPGLPRWLAACRPPWGPGPSRAKNYGKRRPDSLDAVDLSMIKHIQSPGLLAGPVFWPVVETRAQSMSMTPTTISQPAKANQRRDVDSEMGNRQISGCFGSDLKEHWTRPANRRLSDGLD